MGDTPFGRLAQLNDQLEHTRKRLDLAALIAGLLKELEPDEIAPAVRLTIGQAMSESDGRALNISGNALMAVVGELTDAAPAVRDEVSARAVDGGEVVQGLFERARRQPPRQPPLTIREVVHIFEQIAGAAGKGSRNRKETLLRDMLERATPLEAKYLAKIIYQDMRHGVSEGVMLEGIAKAAGVPVKLVNRANQLSGDLGNVALVALTEGETGLAKSDVRLFRPIKPMLAQTAESMQDTFDRYGERLALEYKLDGARVQIHRRGDEVRIYSRNLADVTDSLPDVVAEVKQRLVPEEAILEGEVIAVDAGGYPLPFQHVMRRFGRKRELADTIREIPVQLHLFDLLAAGGRSLIDETNRERWAALEEAAGELRLVRRLIPRTLQEAEVFAEAARSDGHEGVMAKDIDSTYTPGVRGRSWLKLKHVVTLDLVVAAADWGYGRRHGWLSNYHLAARDAETGEYAVVGKTFKGLTDVEFEAMTQRLLALEQSRHAGTVFVQPQVVVEVTFNEIQKSSQYKSGLALRFARITRMREDKPASEADSLQTVRQLYEHQLKGRLG